MKTNSPPPKKKTKVRGIVPLEIFELCIAVRELLYIFGEQKHIFLAPKTGVRGIVPGKIFEFSIAIGEFWYIFGEQTFLSPDTKVRGIVPRKFFDFGITVGEWGSFSENKNKSGVRSIVQGHNLNSAVLQLSFSTFLENEKLSSPSFHKTWELFILGVQTNKLHFCNLELILNKTGYSHIVENKTKSFFNTGTG